MGLDLPKGQFDIGYMPRFGLSQFATRFPSQTEVATLSISGDVEEVVLLEQELADLPRAEVITDFHCVTTWSSRGQRWEGVLFKDVFHRLIQPLARPDADVTFVLVKAQDGGRTSLLLEDLLNDNVILADRLNGQPLTEMNGAPLRLVAPDHYGYKNLKFLNRMSFHIEKPVYRPSSFRFMDHPRARVAYEERGLFFPGWLLRYAYRPLIGSTVKLFAKRATEHLAKRKES